MQHEAVREANQKYIVGDYIEIEKRLGVNEDEEGGVGFVQNVLPNKRYLVRKVIGGGSKEYSECQLLGLYRPAETPQKRACRVNSSSTLPPKPSTSKGKSLVNDSLKTLATKLKNLNTNQVEEELRRITHVNCEREESVIAKAQIEHLLGNTPKELIKEKIVEQLRLSKILQENIDYMVSVEIYDNLGLETNFEPVRNVMISLISCRQMEKDKKEAFRVKKMLDKLYSNRKLIHKWPIQNRDLTRIGLIALCFELRIPTIVFVPQSKLDERKALFERNNIPVRSFQDGDLSLDIQEIVLVEYNTDGLLSLRNKLFQMRAGPGSLLRLICYYDDDDDEEEGDEGDDDSEDGDEVNDKKFHERDNGEALLLNQIFKLVQIYIFISSTFIPDII